MQWSIVKMFKNRNITSLGKLTVFGILEIKIKNLSQQGTIVENFFSNYEKKW